MVPSIRRLSRLQGIFPAAITAAEMEGIHNPTCHRLMKYQKNEAESRLQRKW